MPRHRIALSWLVTIDWEALTRALLHLVDLLKKCLLTLVQMYLPGPVDHPSVTERWLNRHSLQIGGACSFL